MIIVQKKKVLTVPFTTFYWNQKSKIVIIRNKESSGACDKDLIVGYLGFTFWYPVGRKGIET